MGYEQGEVEGLAQKQCATGNFIRDFTIVHQIHLTTELRVFSYLEKKSEARETEKGKNKNIKTE